MCLSVTECFLLPIHWVISYFRGEVDESRALLVIAQRMLVIFTDLSGQPIDPILKTVVPKRR